MYCGPLGTGDLRHGKCTGKLPDVQTQSLCEGVFQASCWLGCRAEGLGWSLLTCGGREEEQRALAQLGPARSTVQRTGDILQFTPAWVGLESKHEWKRNFRSRTQIFLRAGRVSSVLLMLRSLSLNFSLFSSKYVLSQLFACLCCAGNTSPLDTLAFHPLELDLELEGGRGPVLCSGNLHFAPQIDHGIDGKCCSSVMARD